MSWMEAMSVEELERKKRMVVRHGAKQIVLWSFNNEIYAADNRCPHEGYPLAEGTVNTQNCVLTCNWHNWKFRLNDGENLTGEDNLRVYRTKQEAGRIFVHIPHVKTEEEEARIVHHLEKAFRDQSYERMARELARLHYNGSDPSALLRKALEWSHDRFEYGMTHAYAVLADWLTLYRELDAPDQKLVCILEALDYLSEDSLRQPAFPFTRARHPFSEDAFLNAVEEENEDLAVAMALNAIENEGRHFADLERALSYAALRHYQDFGHSLIYVFKAGQVIEHLGTQSERFVLPALVRSIISAYREDLLPEFRNFSQHLAAWPSSTSPFTEADAGEIFGRAVRFTLDWTVRKAQESSPQSMYDALLLTGARHLLHYDISLQSRHDLPVSKNIGWLDFTHAITFANAVRNQCSKFPELWKYGLLQMACFAGRNSEFLNKQEEEARWLVLDETAFYSACVEQLLDHGIGMPIFPAHLVKTFVAARSEAALASPLCKTFVLAGLNRFLHSPIRQKHTRRTARQALELIGRDYER